MSEGGSGSSGAGASGAQGASGASSSQAEGSAQETGGPVSTDQSATPAKESKKAEDLNKPAEETNIQAEESKKETPPEEVPKHRHHDRLTKAFPDKQFNSPEDYDNAMDEYLGGMEKENGDLKDYREKGQKANQRFISLFEAEPTVGSVVRDMINGATFRESVARHVSPEDLTPVEGDPDYENWTKNKISREENATKRMKFEEDYASNLELSAQAVNEFAKENGMDQTASDAFLGKMDEMIADINSGKISKDVLTRMFRAYNYDNDVATAKEQGEIAGRNQNIVAKKENAPAGDGLPRLSTSSEIPEEAPKENYMDSLVARTKRKQVI